MIGGEEHNIESVKVDGMESKGLERDQDIN
jgi:hypothetical protein